MHSYFSIPWHFKTQRVTSQGFHTHVAERGTELLDFYGTYF